MAVDPDYPFFLCPLCGSNAYEPVMVRRQRGAHTVTMGTPFYKCVGCTVAFTDVNKFTRQQKVTRSAVPLYTEDNQRRPGATNKVTPLHRPRKPRR